MKIAALRYTYRFNVGNYQHEEIAVEAVPDDGQTAESLLSETRAFVHENRPGSQGAPVANGNGKPSAAPPLAAKKEAGPDPTTAPTPQPSTTASTTQTGGKRGRGRPPKAVSDARKAVAYAKESATLEELLDRMNDARELASALDLDEWEAAMTSFGAVYKKLNSPDCNPAVVTDLVAAFKAERTAIDTQRTAA